MLKSLWSGVLLDCPGGDILTRYVKTFSCASRMDPHQLR